MPKRRPQAASSFPTAEEKPSQGENVAVGPGGRDEAGKLSPIDLKVGERVLFGKWSGTEVKIDGQELLIMKESDILGVLTDVSSLRRRPRKRHPDFLILSSRHGRRREG
jgi:chaperonin GroES